MKSANPHSGCRAVEVAKTLDTTDPNPSKNQGGIAVVQPIHIIDSIGGQSERGWETEVAPTLKATHYKSPPAIAQAAGFCTEHSAKARGVGYQEECAPTLRAGVTPAVLCKSWDARGNGDGETANTITGDPCHTLSTDSRNYAVICMATQQGGAEIRTDDKAPTITAAAGMSGNNQPVACYPIHDQATRFSGKRGDKADGKGNGLGVGQEGDPMNTLTSGDRHAVAYCTDIGFFNSQEGVSPTLLARSYKDPHLVTYPADSIHYIVRRLTPTECARLQGFADWWGWIEEKKTLTEEDYRFWLEVRNTHARINGKKEQDYTERQMLTWYNKLWTDSSEYKMWGNGIALPTALYCLQGITDALEIEEEDSWML